MNTIAILGAKGQVGQELQTLLHPLGKLACFTHQSLDLSQPDTVAAALIPLKPNIIVNAAAYTAVDQAEQDCELAHRINAIAPTQLAAIAQTLNAKLIHLSTDYVFDGTQGSPYRPTDIPNPISVYGQTKWEGEQGILNHCEHHWILRTAWVYGTYGQRNFVKTMLKLGTERSQLRVVADQIGSPTWAKSIAAAIAALIRTSTTQTVPSGIYHFTNSGAASWYDFAIAIFEEAHSLGIPLQIEQVIPIATSDYPTPARRPSYSLLCCQDILPFLDSPPLYWREALRQMLNEWRNLDLIPRN